MNICIRHIPSTPLAKTSACAVSVSAIDSSLYMPTGVLYCLLTMLLTLPFWLALNGRAELLYPQPMCCSLAGGWCWSDVCVTKPPYCCWPGLGNDPVGVTDGFHVDPPRWTVNSNELPGGRYFTLIMRCYGQKKTIENIQEKIAYQI